MESRQCRYTPGPSGYGQTGYGPQICKKRKRLNFENRRRAWEQIPDYQSYLGNSIPEIIAHENRSMLKFGKPFTDVHVYLDHYDSIFGDKHLMVLHHKKGVEFIVTKFGKEARGPAEEHILKDLMALDPSLTEIPDDWEWWGEPHFSYLDLYGMMALLLDELYG